jgi:hypothetical protein
MGNDHLPEVVEYWNADAASLDHYTEEITFGSKSGRHDLANYARTKDDHHRLPRPHIGMLNIPHLQASPT